MKFYTVFIEEGSRADDPEFLLHCQNDCEMLMVCTSPESLARIVEAATSSLQEFAAIDFCETTAFELADLIIGLEGYGLQWLLFDPVPSPEDGLRPVGKPIPASAYRKVIELIRPAFEKLSTEAVDRFLQESHLNKEPFVRWPNASAEHLAADLLARIEEWTECEE